MLVIATRDAQRDWPSPLALHLLLEELQVLLDGRLCWPPVLAVEITLRHTHDLGGTRGDGDLCTVIDVGVDLSVGEHGLWPTAPARVRESVRSPVCEKKGRGGQQKKQLLILRAHLDERDRLVTLLAPSVSAVPVLDLEKRRMVVRHVRLWTNTS